jgi:nucleoside-diphosphate-sugar epimerase
MRVFVAGGSGTIGVPLVRALVAAGHHVTASTRSPGKEAMLRSTGATPVVVDALDADALRRAVVDVSPTHVIHQLTALPKAGPKRARELAPTNRLRDEGTRHLLAAAIAAGASRVIGGSFALVAAGGTVATDGTEIQAASAAVRSMESQILDAARSRTIEGLVLRYGLFYGPANPATVEMITLVRRRRMPMVRGDRGQLPYIHLDDAVAATVAALEHGSSGSTYDIVDDCPVSVSEMIRAMAEQTGAPRPYTVPAWLPRLVVPYLARLIGLRVPVSNATARRELGWRPIYPSYREGLRQTIERAA